ncbi:MAG: response regulator [Gammaproteobacteria bacterium]
MAKILAVDDSKLMRELVSASLTTQGHEIVTANDGQEALDYAVNNSVDLVITDVNMPNLNGINLLKKLRKLANYSETPILMLTTEDAQYRKDKARTMGANGWLTKPFDPPRLQTAVEKLLGKVTA